LHLILAALHLLSLELLHRKGFNLGPFHASAISLASFPGRGNGMLPFGVAVENDQHKFNEDAAIK
jgi:hypothetical protein